MTPYTGKAFLYIEDGEVVANKMKKPDQVEYIKKYCPRQRYIPPIYSRDLKKWETQHFNVEDWYYGRTEQYKDMYTVGIGLNYYLVANGQPCHIENGKVVKLLT